MQLRAHVDLGHAEEAPVGAHETVVVTHGDLTAGTEGMPVDRSDADAGQQQGAAEQLEHRGDVVRRARALVREHSVEVETVRVELARARGDESLGAVRLLHLVETLAVAGHERVREAVLARIHAQYEDVAFTRETDHRTSSCDGVYQMGDVQARSWIVRGTSGSQQASMPSGARAPAPQTTPAAAHRCWFHRQLGFSTTRA